jgi:hypothetical protein
MRRRIGVVIGLDLDNPAADPVNHNNRADQVGRDLMHAAGKEWRAKSGGSHIDVAVQQDESCGAAATCLQHFRFS